MKSWKKKKSIHSLYTISNFILLSCLAVLYIGDACLMPCLVIIWSDSRAEKITLWPVLAFIIDAVISSCALHSFRQTESTGSKIASPNHMMFGLRPCCLVMELPIPTVVLKWWVPVLSPMPVSAFFSGHDCQGLMQRRRASLSQTCTALAAVQLFSAVSLDIHADLQIASYPCLQGKH